MFLNSIPFYSVSFCSIISKYTGCIIVFDGSLKNVIIDLIAAIFFNSYSNIQTGKQCWLRVFLCYLLILIILLLFCVWPAPFNVFLLYLFIVKMIHGFWKLLAQQYLELPSLSSHMMFNQPPVIVICSFLGIFI